MIEPIQHAASPTVRAEAIFVRDQKLWQVRLVNPWPINNWIGGEEAFKRLGLVRLAHELKSCQPVPYIADWLTAKEKVHA